MNDNYYYILKKYNFEKSNVINMKPKSTIWLKGNIKIVVMENRWEYYKDGEVVLGSTNSEALDILLAEMVGG